MTDELSTDDYIERLQRDGVVLFQYTKTLQCKKAVLSLSTDRLHVRPSKLSIRTLNMCLPHSTTRHRIRNVLGFLFGPNSKTFSQILNRKQHLLGAKPQWCCFSIVCVRKTLDFCVNEADENKLIQIILGVQHLVHELRKDRPPPKWTYANLIAKRGWMKLSFFASQRYMTRLQLLQYHAKRVSMIELGESMRRRRSLWNNKGNAWNPTAELQNVPPHQCVLYRQTLDDFLTHCHEILREAPSSRSFKELFDECRRFTGILRNESNIEIEAFKLFHSQIPNIIDTISVSFCTEQPAVVPGPAAATEDSGQLAVTRAQEYVEEEQEHKYDDDSFPSTPPAIEEEKNDSNPTTTCTTESSTRTRTESSQSASEEEEKKDSHIGAEEKNDSNQNNERSGPDTEGEEAEFEYYQTLMTQFMESYSNSASLDN